MKRYLNKLVTGAILLAVCLSLLPVIGAIAHEGDDNTHHVLLLSIDGLHGVDVANYVRLHPNSALAQLSNMGLTYTNASTSKPSDSFPGILSMTTGWQSSFNRRLL